jgi:natural product biosynthesis luciferase-like monooxygenase protein
MTVCLNDSPDSCPNVATLIDLLQSRANQEPDKTAYIFLADGETEEDSLTYQELDQRSQAIAAHLQRLNATGSRALLLYPPGLEFITAFFGCLYAGVVAVPAYPPRLNHSLSRLQAIIADAQATIALTTTSILSNLERRFTEFPELKALHWLATDKVQSDTAVGWQLPHANSNTLAFLQYTSGSTGTPKGVMVSHGNVLHNQRLIQQGFQHTKQTIFVGWLPLYHDMGLIGNVLQPLYLGIPCILMSPVAFLQRPFNWLQAISRYKATTSGGPNFAYDLCVRKITPEQRSQLDLSSWEVAFNGAEPVRAETIERFTQTFAPCGFRREAFYPCYGMAENTLIVSGGLKSAPPILQNVQGEALEKNQVILAEVESQDVRTLVGCGQALGQQKMAMPTAVRGATIANPETLTRCASNQVGEIWVSGASVAQGYWQRPVETEYTFQAYLADTGEGPYLRTGDLGFLQDGELFVTGRLKDLIIIRGRNHYPQDIELTVEQSHPALRSSAGAAFSIEVDDEERLVVVQEVERTYLRKLDVDEVVGAIRQAVWKQHELQVYAVLLLKTAGIPKTSSGKIQRHACRQGFLEESLSVVGSSILEVDPPQPPFLRGESISLEQPLVSPFLRGTEGGSNSRESVSLEQRTLELDLRNSIAKLLQIPLAQLNLQQPINTLGLDSLKAIEIKNDLEANFEVVLPMETFLEDVTIAQLANQILTEGAGTEASELAASSAQPAAPSQKQSMPANATQSPTLTAKERIQFSLFYFSSNEAEFANDKYQLLIDGAKFADEQDFTAVWIPERHFHAFGGIYPNPSVLASALAMVTKRVRLRAGSVVLPLHHPIRVAEEWSVVDNLSGGRVDLAFARGWNPNDFVLAPKAYKNRTEALYSNIQTVQKLWRGELISLPNGVGEQTPIKIYPLPKQPELPIWITCSGGKERFIEAGAMGANILTALLFQPIEELGEKIAIYRNARAKHGYAPDAGHVTLMLHTFVGEDLARVRQQVRQPFTNYLKTSVDLWRQSSQNLDELTEKEREDLLAYAFERYFQTSALFGTPDTCLEMVNRLKKIGVDEIACLIDFGVEVDAVMKSLDSLKHLKDNLNAATDEEDQLLKPADIPANIDANQAQQLLSNLDQLSEQEVDALLSKLLVTEEVNG